ncbi:glycosyltransferase [Leifsonia shinshuensis]|uniref:glycosyltransferase family 2 protein n=1 Tax=Leifsonia shinshuensis TaxID=150026 RepID=UPI001F510DDA|nr:glycosyltransferase family 2 protein [Leifsonia shinshuensis]MCI0158199.1 glycosyltransferase [Leifsonia shinshuensis]
MTPSPVVTVAILTYNGEKYIERILKKLRKQDFAEPFEVLVIDSGSTDRTLEIVRSYEEVRLHEIPNSEFGHGKTRNLAAQLANGEFVAYLTHDAVPSNRKWLSELIAPFQRFPEVMAVLGKQVARPRAFPLQKYEIHGMFRHLGPDFGTTLFYATPDLLEDAASISVMSYYSDVNSAVRRKFLLEVIPYRDVRYAEDQMFGRDLILAGYTKAYAPRAMVEHSNDLTLQEYGHRIFDETVGLRQIGNDIPVISRAAVVTYAAKGTIGDGIRIARDRAYSWKRKAYWLTINPAFHFAKWNAYRRSALVDLDDHGAIQAGSLEHKRKVKHEQRSAESA